MLNLIKIYQNKFISYTGYEVFIIRSDKKEDI